nr:hypothetical protein [Tanacetum cinerariifolium]
MGDENPVRTLGDYSKPSHEGYKNTIELIELRSDTIRLVQNGCSFPGLRSEDPNQHLKDFLKLVDSLNLNGSISTWEDLTTCFLTRFFPPKRTAKLRNDIIMFQQHQGDSLSEAWTRFKDLLQKVPHHDINLWFKFKYTTIEGNIDYENPNIEQLLGVMKYNVDILMKDAISLMGRSESVFGMTSNEIYQLLLKPLRQQEFKHIVTNFILDQEERVKQLEEYMEVIMGDFMEVPIFDELEPQTEPLPNNQSLNVIFDKKKLGSSYEVSLDDSWRTI